MAFTVTNWNIDENRDWYVRLADSGSDISIELYHTASNAQHQTTRIASGSVVYGPDQEVVLTADTGYTVELFQIEYTWHLKVTGAASDPTKVFQVRTFTEIPSISHPLFRNTDLIAIKGGDMIDRHTNAKIRKSLPLGTHIPDIVVGDTITVNSTRRNVNEVNQIFSHTISARIQKGDVRLTSTIESVSFLTITK